MKKITTFLFSFLMIVFAANAQYYFNEINPAGQNPGDLNNDPEQPLGSTPGYTTIFPANTTTNSWSSVQTIPFAFDFDGSPVTDYIVSNSGVLTFTTSPTPTIIPSVNNDIIPNAGIPDKSVLIWGLQQLAGNDAVASQTYGTAPNRQHWIKFLSYSAPGASGQQWTYWSMVLEETTNKIYIVDERTFNTPLTLTIGVQINSTTAYSVGSGANAAPNTPSFVTNGGNASDATDNVYYEFIQGTRPTNDAVLSGLDPISSLVAENTSVTISGEIRNNGSADLNSVDVNWTIDGVNIRTDQLSGLSLATSQSTSFTHTMTWSASNAGSFSDIQVWTSNPNGVSDDDTSNDSLSARTFVNIGNTVARNSVFEQFTTAACQFCPDGAWIAGQINDNIPEAITTSVHSCFGTDNMTNVEASDLCATLGIGAAPTGMVDRKLFSGETDVAFGRLFGYPNWQGSAWTTRVQEQIAAGTEANLVVYGSYDNANRQLAANVDVSFSDYILPGDVRVSLQLIEDSVSGNGTGWDQINAYNTQAGHPFAGQGNPIANYQHRRVLRGILPDTSTWGMGGVVPENYSLNTTYTANFTTTIPNNYDPSRMYLVATVNYFGDADVTQYAIINAKRVKMDQITSIEDVKSEISSLNIYPNPTGDAFTNLEFNLNSSKRIEARLLDITGKEVGYQDFGVMAQGNQRVQINTDQLQNGFYFINLRVGDEIVTKKISVVK